MEKSIKALEESLAILTKSVPTDAMPKLKLAVDRLADFSKTFSAQVVELHNFFTMSLDLLCVAGTDGMFKKLNPAFSKVLGYSADELLSQPFLDFVHPDDLAATVKEVEKLSSGASTIGFENRYRTKDGSYRLFSWTSVPDTKTGLLYATARDITEQRKREVEHDQIFAVVNEAALIARKDTKGNIIEVNDQFCKISGYSRQELIGKNHSILNHCAQGTGLSLEIWDTISSGRMWRGDIKNTAKDGSLYWVRTVISPIKDFQNKIISYLSVRFDITLEKAAEEENRFILDCLGLGIWKFNPTTQELHWDNSMYRLYDLNPADFSGHYNAWESSLTLEGKTKAVDELGKALRGEKEFDTIFEIQTKVGKRSIGARGKVIRDAAGAPQLMYGVNWDVTNAKLTEDKLIEKEQLLSTILDTLPVAVFAKDIQQDFQWVLWNKYAEELFGLKAKDCLGKSDFDFFPIEQARFFLQKDIEASQSKTVLDIPEEPASTKNGYVTLHTKKTVIRDEKGSPKILLGICENISPQKEAQKQLIHSAKMSSLGEMAAGVAHEINNPLAIIHGKARRLLKVLANGKVDAKEIQEDLQKIEMTSDRITKIVKGLRSFSRNAEKDPMEKILLNQVIDDTMAFCKERFKNHGVELRINLESDLIVECSPPQLGQVLLNLLNNAHDAIENLPEKWVELTCCTKGDWVEIGVTDSGPGIPEAIADRMMEPFFTTKEVGKGTGLGLSLSKGIIEDHHGKLSLDRRATNTRFVIELPAFSQSQMEKKAA